MVMGRQFLLVLIATRGNRAQGVKIHRIIGLRLTRDTAPP
jgi:hypothetical protein